MCVSVWGGASHALAAGGLMADNPWLGTVSPYIQEIDAGRAAPGMTSLGVFGVGNGFAFALQGLQYPQNKLTNLVGPIYEKDEELQFLDVWAELADGASGAAVKLPKSKLTRVSSTSIIVCEEKNDAVSMTSVTYAPPGITGIFRVIELRNISKQRIESLSLVVKSGLRGEKASDFGEGKIGQLVKGRKMVVGGFSPGAKVENGELRFDIGPLEPGAARDIAIYIMFGWDKDTPAPPVDLGASPGYPLLAETRADWLKWFDGAMSVTALDKKLEGLFESTLALLRVQMSAGSGAISPMGKYSGFWCRDNFGPVRFLLAAGKYDDVRRSLEYFDYATRVSGFRNRYPLDIPIDPIPPEPDWEKMTPQQGDDPDLLILQYYWYYRATGDAKFIRDHYGFLRRNLTGQQHTDFRLPFNGDETYQVYVMMAESAPMKDFYTPASGFFYTAAAEALSEMAEAIGQSADAADFAARAKKCRDKTEEYYWNEANGWYIPYVRKDTLAPSASPFADVNFSPIWIGYDTAASEKQRSNALKSAAKLVNKRGTVRSTARCQLYTGMAPGMLLYNMKAVGDLDAASATYRGLMDRVISHTGEFAEGYDSTDRWINYGSAPTVYRPWESAINAEAVLYYLTGLRYDNKTGVVTVQPRIIPGEFNVTFENIHAGQNDLTIVIGVNFYSKEASNGTPVTTIINNGNKDLTIELIVEPIPALSQNPPSGFEPFFSPEYNRTLWRVKATIEPGEQKLF